MNLELKGGEKFGVDDQQDKVNRNFRKEEGHNKEKNPSKQNEINSLPSEKYDHALEQAVQESETRKLHQLEKVLHQNRKPLKTQL